VTCNYRDDKHNELHFPGLPDLVTAFCIVLNFGL
jgi:hypothetical protein